MGWRRGRGRSPVQLQERCRSLATNMATDRRACCDHRAAHCRRHTQGKNDLNQQALSAFIWSVADLLRGDYKQSEYGKVILPFTVLRRLDCVLAPTKAKVLAEYGKKTQAGINPDPFLK